MHICAVVLHTRDGMKAVVMTGSVLLIISPFVFPARTLQWKRHSRSWSNCRPKRT